MAQDDAARAMYEEARISVEEQIRVSQDLDDKAAWLFRFAALVLAIVLTGISIAATWTDVQLYATASTTYTVLAAAVLVIVSALCSLGAYQRTDLQTSLDPSDLAEAVDTDLSEGTLYREAVRTYGEKAYPENGDRLRSIAAWYRAAMLSLWSGLATLLAAALTLFHLGLAWAWLGVASVSLLLIGFSDRSHG